MRTLPVALVCAVLFALVAGLPAEARAQFTADKPNDVGTVFMPFVAANESDDSLAFLLEDLVGAKLRKKLRRPVYVGRDVTVALTGTASACLRSSDCVILLGGQFNSSLVASVLVLRKGSDIQIDVDFYTTGNGLKATRESFTFPVGDEDLMIGELARLIDELFETSLKIRPESLTAEGGVIGGPEDEDRIEELERSRRKKVSSRREDFGSVPPSRLEDDAEPGDLRGELADEADEEEELETRPAPRKTKGKQSRDEDMTADVSDLDDAPDDEPEDIDDEPTDDDIDLDDAPPEEEPEELSLSASQTRGDSVTNYMEAQRVGIGKREYERMARSGMPFDEFVERRWAYGRRFHLKVQGFYGLGGLTRRYASTIFVRAGNVKTEEYGWESLGASFANPGGTLGVGFAPIDILEIALDVGVMYARQDLRREYDGQEIGSNIPQTPQSASTAHVVADLAVRMLLLPKKKVKIAPQVGATVLVMSGYNIVADPPLTYSPRPAAVVVGVTAGAGVVIALSPFVGLDIGITGTYFVAQGAAKYEEYQFFDGVTEPFLDPAKLGARLPEVPAMGRLTVGPRFLF